MHITAKHDGSPRRTIDFQALNPASHRQSHHTSSPWKLVSSIPENTNKLSFDAYTGYHSLPLASKQDKAFLNQWGRYRYLKCPQGFIVAGEAYTNRMNRITQEVPRKKSCIDVQ